MKKLVISVLFAFGMLTSIAQAQDVATASATRIGPRDVLEIKVVQDEKLNSRVTVSDEGQITLPLIGKVDVSGLTAREVETRIKSTLESHYITRADVSVQVTEFGNKPISVVGAVTHPGTIGTTGNSTLLQALTQPAGLAPCYRTTI